MSGLGSCDISCHWREPAWTRATTVKGGGRGGREGWERGIERGMDVKEKEKGLEGGEKERAHTARGLEVVSKWTDECTARMAVLRGTAVLARNPSRVTCFGAFQVWRAG